MKSYFLILLSLLLALQIHAQELKVKVEFHEDPFDMDARSAKYAKTDLNGRTCALIKISLVDPNASFEGDTISIPIYKKGEWWVYVIEGSQFLTIKTDNHVPLELDFAPVKSRTTYKTVLVQSQQHGNSSTPLLPFIVDEKIGYLDKDGNIAIPAIIDSHAGSKFYDGIAHVDNGFIDRTGCLVFSTENHVNYEKRFSEGLLAIDGGYIDTLGLFVIAPKENRITRNFHEGMAAFLYMEDSLVGFLNKQSEIVIKPQYLDAKKFSEGLCAIKSTYGKWGYINKSGELIIPCIYKEAYSFCCGRSIVGISDELYGIIDNKGILLHTISGRIGGAQSFPGYDIVNNEIVFSENLISSTSDTNVYHYIDINGTVQENLGHYLGAGSFSEGLAAVMNDQKDYGYINKQGTLVIPYQFCYGSKFEDGFAVVYDKTGKWVYIDKRGNILADYRGSSYCASYSDYDEDLELHRKPPYKITVKRTVTNTRIITTGATY